MPCLQRQVGCLNKHVEREIVNHSLLAHPHIIAFRECFLTTDYLAISTEYAAGGDLFRWAVCGVYRTQSSAGGDLSV